MLIDQDEICRRLEAAIQTGISRISFAEPRPQPRTPQHLHPAARILLPLAGGKHITYAAGGQCRNGVFAPGEALLTSPGSWSREIWDTPHQMISVVFFAEMIRVIFISHDGKASPPTGPDVFFHTSRPLENAGRKLLEALLELRRNCHAAHAMLQALLELTAETVRHDRQPELSAEEREWRRAVEAMQTNFLSDIVREDLAAAARLHPAKLSRLVRKRMNLSVREFLAELRLDYARQLLCQSDLPVKAVAEQCAYNYPGYFIREFRRKFGCTPAVFRRNIVSQQNNKNSAVP